jgi:hypothetical protein
MDSSTVSKPVTASRGGMDLAQVTTGWTPVFIRQQSAPGLQQFPVVLPISMESMCAHWEGMACFGMAMAALAIIPETGKTPCHSMIRASANCMKTCCLKFHQRTKLRIKK